MGNSTPQDSPQDRANEARSKHPEQTGSSAANLPDQDFLETEEELNLDDIDWSMLTDLSTKITTGLDTSSGKQSDAAANALPLDLDLPNWAEGENETDASLAEMLGFEALEGDLGDLEEELGLGTFNDDFSNQEPSVNDLDLDPFEDREFNRDWTQSASGTESLAREQSQNITSSTADDWGSFDESDREFVDMADMTVVNANAQIPSTSTNEFELGNLYEPTNELGEMDEFADLEEEEPIAIEMPSDEEVSWNLVEQDLQEFSNPTNVINNDDDVDEPGWGDDAQYAESSEDDDAQLGTSYTAYGTISADVPDYYADEVEPEVPNQKEIQTPSQDLMSDFGEDTSGELFPEMPPPRDIPQVQSAPASSDYAPAPSNWEFANVSDLETSTAEIDRNFSDLDAADEEFSDSTRIEDGGDRSGDLSSERYSASWEQELSSSYYAEATEPGQEESFNLAPSDEGWTPTSDQHESLNLVSTDIEDAFGDSGNVDWQEEFGQTSGDDLDFSDADDTNISRSEVSPEVPQVLPSLPSLPPLPPLPSLPPLNQARLQSSSGAPSDRGRLETKSQRGFEQFDLPDLEWSETVSPRLGDDTGVRKAQSSEPGGNPPNPKDGPRHGTTEYKKVLSENLSSDMSWSEILDMQPDISAEPLNIPALKSTDSSPDLRQGRSPAPNLPSNMPVDRVDRIEQMGAFADAGNTDFNTPGFAGIAESLGVDDLSPRDRAQPRMPRINFPNFPELWEQYGQNLKIPAIALGAIATMFGFFSIPPIKRFTVETGLRIGFNKDASGQDLTGVNFKGSNLEKANFTNANLTNANLESVNLKNAILIGTKLDSANLQKADLKAARFVGASLVQTNLTSAALNLADLSEANLTKANLSKANMSGARLKDSKIESAKIDPEDKLMWQIVNEPKANRNLAGINMTGFNLSAAKLQAATLTDAKLTWADLSKSDLSNAKLDGTDLSGANLQGANLKGASLAQSKWTKERVPKTDDQTICPNGAKGPCKL